MEIFPLNSKKKGKESYVLIVYITFKITVDGLLVFFDDELTTFRFRFISNVKIKISFKFHEKTVAILHKTEIFKYAFNTR